MNRFSISEIGILIMCVICIFVSEYIYLSHGDPIKAIFLGLWPPTILSLMNYINNKRK